MGINKGFRVVGWYGIIVALPAMAFGGRLLAVITKKLVL